MTTAVSSFAAPGVCGEGFTVNLRCTSWPDTPGSPEAKAVRCTMRCKGSECNSEENLGGDHHRCATLELSMLRTTVSLPGVALPPAVAAGDASADESADAASTRSTRHATASMAFTWAERVRLFKKSSESTESDVAWGRGV